MFITLHEKKEINVEGIYTSKSCKPVFNMSTGKIYASGLATCDAIGAYPADLSRHLHGMTKTIKGMRFCFVSEVSDHVDEIAYIISAKQETIDTQAETIRTQEELIAQLRAVVATYEAEQETKRAAKAELERRKAEYETKRQALEEEARALQELEESLKED